MDEAAQRLIPKPLVAEPMSRRESIYLDLLRSLASLAVVLDHAPALFNLPSLPRWGYQAVMVFFVLSGYVISHVADTRETTPRVFVVARLARLWSVLVPAIVLTIVCDAIGREFGTYPASYALAPTDLPPVRIGAALAFMADSWVSIQLFSNSVIWSLCAEFWYYMLFAVWTFVPPGRTRTAAMVVVALLAGDKAVLMLPVWLLGVALQRSRALRRLSTPANVALCLGGFLAVALVLATRAYDPAIAITTRMVGPWLFRQLAGARVFWFNWLFGLAIAAHLLGARAVVTRLPMERIAGPVRWCAGVSFAAYLFHMPLLHLCAAFLPADQGWLAIALTLAVIAVLGPPVEGSKRWWRRWLNWAAGQVLSLLPKRTLATPG